MRVSIVIPAYNAEKYLGQTIEGVLAQTMTDWELIVVNDGSADGTTIVAQAYASRDSRLRIVQQHNGGLAAARNRGFVETNGASEYVIFLDADDVWEKEALSTLADALDIHPRAVAASGLSRYIDSNGQRFLPGKLEMWGRSRLVVKGKHLAEWPLFEPTTFAVLASRNCIGTPGQALVRRSILEAVGPFDSLANPCEDWDIWLRLSQYGHIDLIDGVVLNYRWHESNMSRNIERMTKGQGYVRRKLLCSPILSAEQRRIVVIANCLWSLRVRSERFYRAKRSLAQGQLRQAARLLCQVLVGYFLSLRGIPIT